MLSKLRNFSKSKPAILLIVIIIIPFVFWGMGSVFSGGNTNNVAKINNKNISTQDFIKYINESKIDPENLRKNIENNVFEEILTQYISLNILNMEVNNLGVYFSDKALLHKIKSDKSFFDNGKFSRIQYEKFLLENNVSAAEHEKKIKDGRLQSELFTYIIGGIRSPDFLIKNFFLEETKEIEVEYINLENIYKREFNSKEIQEYLKNNEKELTKDVIDVTYAKITPETLIDTKEYSNEYFEIIDEIENRVLNNEDINLISDAYNLKLVNVNEIGQENKEIFLNDIYKNRYENKIQIIDKEDYFLIYEIKSIIKQKPDLSNEKIINSIKEKLKSIYKFNYNKEILKKIETNKFNDEDFNDIIKKNNSKISKILIKSQNDNSFFNVDSLKLLYTIPLNDFLLIVDNNKNVYLTKIINFNFKDIQINSEDFKQYLVKSNFRLKNYISTSYDDLISKKYNIKINYNSLEKIKNYFK
tara:strand:- start:2315 stop:3733 length:1419 start_codon:yes stop_codon:yes gene_type:complete